MKTSLRCIILSSLLLLCLAGPAAAQYMKITTDNPGDNTRMRATGTTLLTITLDTDHDRNGLLQTCNSHASSNCGAPSSGEPLDMFYYTLAFKAVGGTVLWGTFTASDAAYTDISPQISNSTEIEINQFRPPETFTPAGLSTLGTLPVTVLSGSPAIQLQIGGGLLNPSGFGNGFGTSCGGFAFAHSYVLGEPSDPCGNLTGLPGDWFDWDGAASACLGCQTPPQIEALATVSAREGSQFSISATATDPDASDILTLTVAGQPPQLPGPVVTGPSPLITALTGTPGFNDAGTYTIHWMAVDSHGLSADAFTNLVIANTNRAPTLNPIANMSVTVAGCGPTTADQAISGSDPDGDALTFSKVSGPTYMTVTTTAPTTGNIHIAPSSSDHSSGATVQTSDGALTDSKSFFISIAIVNQGPVLNQPANMTVTEGATADQTLMATDPCGAPLTFSKVGGPTFMTVTTIDGTTGNVHLTPGFADAGTYAATVRASNGSVSSDKSLRITVIDSGNHPPVLNPIANMSLCESATADQVITGSDPDGDVLTFSKAAGPTFMTVATTSPTSGNIHVAPSFADAGSFPATARASDGSLNSDQSFFINVTEACRAPTLNAIADMTVTEGMTADQTITAVDPEGVPITFSKVSGPIFMIVSTTDPGTGAATGDIHLAPGFADSGVYPATVRATAPPGLSNDKSFTITVLTSGNRCPVANPGGPYSGLAGVPVSFDGSASSDPDGNPLTYAWDFDASNGITVDAVGAMASHAYAAAGTFTVTLTVKDNGDGDPTQACSASATTTASIAAACDASIFNGYDTIRLGSGKPFWFAYVQPATGCYVNTDVITSSFVMKYAGRQIPAEVTKTSIGGDKSGDGIQEIKVSWSKDNLRTLFTGTGLSNGHNPVTVTIEANLVSGGKLSGTTQLDIVNNGNFTVSAVAPNPLNPEATLTYTTLKQGFVRVDMFDIQGRLVRRLVDAPVMTAGTHEVKIDGRGERGERLPSGVYYIRGTSSEGAFKHLVTILK